MAHILLVEDEERMARTLEKGLKKAGHEVTIVTNGLSAKNSDLSQFDAVILDWNLPLMPGVDVLRHWRREENQIPVLMLTARGETMDKVTGLDWGADDYMSKFFEWEELLARLRVLLRRNQKQVEKAGNITFDRINGIFYENDQVIKLTATEHSILKYFFNNPKKIITKTTLIRAIYDHATNPYSNVIERHIKSIRKKTNYDPFETIKNMGYRLQSNPSTKESQS